MSRHVDSGFPGLIHYRPRGTSPCNGVKLLFERSNFRISMSFAACSFVDIFRNLASNELAARLVSFL